MVNARLRIKPRQLLLLVGMCLVVSSCSGPSAHEEADFQEAFNSRIKMYELLDTVKDAKSAEAAKPSLEELYWQIQELDKKFHELPEEKKKKLYQRYDGLFKQSNTKMGEQAKRLIHGELPKGMTRYCLLKDPH